MKYKTKLTNKQLWSMFEVLEQDFGATLVQSSQMCKVRLEAGKLIPACKKGFGTFSFSTGTGCVTVTGPETHVEELMKLMRAMDESYARLLDRRSEPSPVGPTATAVIIKKLRVPAFSKYLEDVDYADEVPESTEVPTKNMAVPKDKEYHQAVNAIAAMGAEYLSQWPGWSRHFAQFMCYEMGAEFHDVCEFDEYMDEATAASAVAAAATGSWTPAASAKPSAEHA